MSEIQTGSPPRQSSGLPTTHHLAPPDRDRFSRKLTPPLANSYQSPSLAYNTQNQTAALTGESIPEFIRGDNDQPAVNGVQGMKNPNTVGFADVPLQMLPQNGNGGGASGEDFRSSEAFVTPEVPSAVSNDPQRRQQGGNANTKLSEMNKRKAMVRQQRNVRITGLLFVVTAVFILSWVPPYIAMVKGFYIGYSFPFSLGEWLLLSYGRSVYVINTFSNPIIYAAMSATYRKHIVDLVKALWRSVRSVRCRW